MSANGASPNSTFLAPSPGGNGYNSGSNSQYLAGGAHGGAGGAITTETTGITVSSATSTVASQGSGTAVNKTMPATVCNTWVFAGV